MSDYEIGAERIMQAERCAAGATWEPARLSGARERLSRTATVAKAR